MQSRNQSKIDNFVCWSSSYLSDCHPLVPQTIVLYSSLNNFIISYFGNQCNDFNISLNWILLIIILIYLTWIGHKVSKYKSNFILFFYQFCTNYIVLILLLAIQTGMPPFPVMK